jgi:hypothetical protein
LKLQTIATLAPNHIQLSRPRSCISRKKKSF